MTVKQLFLSLLYVNHFDWNRSEKMLLLRSLRRGITRNLSCGFRGKFQYFFDQQQCCISQIERALQLISLTGRNLLYYMEESVLLGTKTFVDSIRHFIRDPSGLFSVCHLCVSVVSIVQWRHDSRLLLLLNWFLHIIKITLHVGSKIWILCSRGKNNISLVRCAHWWDIVLATRT